MLVRRVPVPPDFEYFGPALTIAQAEAETLEKLAGEPEAPQVPFGYLHTEWQDLKNRMLTGDTIREFKANYYGGYVVLRRKCFVGEMIEWVH